MNSLPPMQVTDSFPGFDKLFQWATGRGADIAHVCVAENKLGMKGIFANKDFEPGEQIILIPEPCILTSNIARASAIGQAISEANPTDQSDHAYLAMFMLADQASHISRWHHYYNNLPREFTEHPLFYDEEQLARLKGSRALEMIYRRRFSLQQSYQSMVDALGDSFRFTLPDYQITRTAINTRCFGVNFDDSEQAAMIPVIDMINHGDDDSTERGCDGNGYGVWAKKPIAKGDEITHSYGQKCQQRYFANYGFLRESTIDDECQVTIQLDSRCPSLSAKMAQLDISQPVMELALGNDLMETLEQAMPVLRIAASEAGLQDEVELTGEQIRARDMAALSLLKTALEKKLACYQSKNQPHSRFAATDTPMITAFLQREQQLLRDYLEFCLRDEFKLEDLG
ncbi:SET domain-containing protein [Thalassomonas actiniarum]|uniref:SET domain-containing protein n=1 Tax=Thalassomonas actiniarum TaxID=485447 RepID=A0AAE9YVU4_9GAMM|nr:SET domain-containing protein [Thalassomonas actiniarum]WDE02201.1 SET domain-containing protein [Thalassomonas actiniarum]